MLNKKGEGGCGQWNIILKFALSSSGSCVYLMNLEGVAVLGPSLPNKWSILVASTPCSQSSINSHKWYSPEKGESEG